MANINKIKLGDTDYLIRDYTGKTRMAKKQFICIGDSYGMAVPDWTGWVAEFSNLVSGTNTVYASAVGGSGFIGDTNYSNFLQQLQTVAQSVTEPQTITDIVVMGGYNDASTSRSQAALDTAFANFKSYCTTTFPNADIHVGFCAINYLNTGFQATLNYYNDMYKGLCEQYNMCFIENMQYVLLNTDYIIFSSSVGGEGFHPNTSGCVALALKLREYFINGHFDVEYGESFENVAVYSKNGNVSVSPATSYPLTISSGTIPFNTWTQKEDLSQVSKLLWGTHNSGTTFNFLLPVMKNSGEYVGTLAWRILDKSLEYCNLSQVSGMDVSGGGYSIMSSLYIPFRMNY